MKSLFKQLIQQTTSTQKPAKQVAAGVGADRTKKEERNNNQKQEAEHQTSTNGTADAKPTMKISNIGLSWNKLKGVSQASKMQILPGTSPIVSNNEENENFTQEELELQWMSMCNRMPPKLSGIATRMKNLNPVILEMPDVEVEVPNQIVKDEMEAIKGSIMNTLKIYLHNASITLNIRVAKNEGRIKVLTRREQFELMESQSPVVARLRKMFDLQLA